jgi:hypothetical protein
MTIDWEAVKDWGPYIVAAIAAFVSLKLRPLEREIRQLHVEHDKLEMAFESHLRDSTEAFSNFNRWRGEVGEGLRQNGIDHCEIKEQLRALMTMLTRHLEKGSK